MIFFGTLMIDSIQFRIFTNKDDLLPDFESLLSFTQIINNITLLFVVLRFISFYIIFLVFIGEFRKPIHYAILSQIMAFCYFISVKDTYQHHYLVIMIVFLMSLENEIITTHRRILTLVSIVYFYTAITKLDSPRFMSGSQLCNSTMFCTETDKLYGFIINSIFSSSGVFSWSADQSLEMIDNLCFIASWSVIGVELYLSLALLVNPFSIVNSVLMFVLHGLIMVFEIINPRMNTNLFSVYMMAISILCLPPTEKYTSWIETYVIPSHKMMTPLLNKKRARPLYRIIILLIISGFFVGQAYIPYARCYTGKTLAFSQNAEETYQFYHENPEYLDERFCWRMFSDIANRRCLSSYYLISPLIDKGKVRRPLANYGSTMDDIKDHSHLLFILNPEIARMKALMLCWNSQMELSKEFNQTPARNSTQVVYYGACEMSKFPSKFSKLKIIDKKIVNC